MPSALDDLKNIRDYIAKDSVYYAKKFVDGAFKAAERLEYFSKSGRMVPEMENPALREIIYGSYRIIYELDNSNVQILTVIHGMRLLPKDDNGILY
jgi:plasmid stabilization system protein ParE